MWEPAAASFPPETHPSGVRQPPPRLPPAPPGTAGAVPNFGKPEPQPYTLHAALRECMLHVRSIRLFLKGMEELQHATPELTLELLDAIAEVRGCMWGDEIEQLRASFDYVLLRLLRWPKRSPDADHPSTKTRLLHAIREGAHLSLLFQILEQRSLIGEVITPPTTLTVSHLPLPAHCPEWALDLLPPRSLVRWIMEDVDRALNVAQNYESLERFDAVIAFPLAALTAALPSRGVVAPYEPDR